MSNIDKQKHAAKFVRDITATHMIPRHVGRQNLEHAFSQIVSLITSRNQGDVDSGMDSLHVLTRFLERNTSPFDAVSDTEVMPCLPND